MSERVRLIKLLESAESAVYWNSSDQGFIQKIADHLLANGVRLESEQATSDENKRWVPVSERLPGKNDNYLVFERSPYGGWCEVISFAKDGSEVDEYDLGGCENVWYDYDSEYGYIPFVSVTHWMPLPEAPKEV